MVVLSKGKQPGFFSLITYYWANKPIDLACKKTLTHDNIEAITDVYDYSVSVPKLEKIWSLNVGKSFLRRWSAMIFKFSQAINICCLLSFAGTCCSLLFPLIISWLLKVVSLSSKSALVACGMLFVLITLKIYLINYSYFVSMEMGHGIRYGLAGVIYNKILRMNNTARDRWSIGHIMSIGGLDPNKITAFLWNSDMWANGPVTLVVCLSLLIWLGGWCAFVGLGIILVYFGVQMLIINKIGKFRQRRNELSVQRIALTQEVIANARLLKYMHWEKSLIDRIVEVRKVEVRYLRYTLISFGISIILTSWIPLLSSAITVLLLTVNNMAKAPVLFAIMNIYSLLAGAINIIPNAAASFLGARAACRRMTTLLDSEESNLKGDEKMEKDVTNSPSHPYTLDNDDKSLLMTAGQISFVNATFVWEYSLKHPMCKKKKHKKEKKHKFRKLLTSFDQMKKEFDGIFTGEFGIPQGSLVMVYGKVGSGKSSLLSAISGKMKLQSGEAHLPPSSTTNTVFQQSWIVTGTIRDNICFGREWNRELYEKVLEECALLEDISMMPDGDLTLVGEKGVQLSGGQKQRICLARLVFGNPIVALLDDPLSAVDPKVASHIFERCINGGLLSKSTRVMVTNNRELFSMSDFLINMKNGICHFGTFDSTTRRLSKFDDDQRVGNHQDNSLSCGNNDNDVSSSSSSSEDEEEGNLIQKPVDKIVKPTDDPLKKQQSSHKSEDSFFALFEAYSKNAGNGFYKLFLVVFLILFGESSKLYRDIILKSFINHESVYDTATFVTIYCGLTLIQGICMVLAIIYFTCIHDHAVGNLHSSSLTSLVMANQSYFDQHSVGALTSHFSSDLEQADEPLGQRSINVLATLGTLYSATIMLTLAKWWLPILMIPVIFTGGFYYSKFRITWRTVQQLISQAIASLSAHLNETLTGIAVIKDYKVEEMFKKKMCNISDIAYHTTYAGIGAWRWVSIRISSLGWYFILGCISLCIVLKVDEKIIGLLIINGFAGAQIIDWTIKALGEVEANLVYFGQVNRLQLLEPEEIIIADNQQALRPTASIKTVPILKSHEPYQQQQQQQMKNNPVASSITTKSIQQVNISSPAELSIASASSMILQDWPNRGRLRFDNIVLKLGNNTVLNELQLDVRGGTKVGIVGRTGAGKSSLISALFRLAPLFSGRILLDGVDISSIPLELLRTKISIVPQEPVILKGTVKFNLDPNSNNSHSEDDYWECLEQIGLAELFHSQANKLDTQLDNTTACLTSGQKQLLCVGRALMRKSKILVLDEATANIDKDTDKIIQQLVQTMDITVLSIAHRIEVVMPLDIVIVMDRGRVIEQGNPRLLIKMAGSIFGELARADLNNNNNQ